MSHPNHKASSSEGEKGNTNDTKADGTIVVIGMRGAGKTTMGKFAARVLDRKFEDVDHYFEKTLRTTTTTMELSTAILGISTVILGFVGMRRARRITVGSGGGVLGRQEKKPSTTAIMGLTATLGLSTVILGYSTARHPNTIPDYIKANAWSGFRQRETEMLNELLKNHPTGYVISCGGGIVESEPSRNALQKHKDEGGIVLYLDRNINDIEAFLNADATRPKLPEPIRDVWLRREGWYQSCSNRWFKIPEQQVHGDAAEDAKMWALAELEFKEFLKGLDASRSV